MSAGNDRPRGGGRSLGPERVAQLDELRLSFSALLAAERRFRSRRRQEPGGLSIAQMRALIELGREGSATPGELAIASDLRPASVTAMLDHLELDGLIVRCRDSEDGRRVIVSLTAAGLALLAEKQERWRRFGDEALADLSASELSVAVRAMRALAVALEQLAAEEDAK